MRSIIALPKLREHASFHNQALQLFDNLEYLPKRPNKAQLMIALQNCDVLFIGVREIITSEMVSELDQLPRFIATLSIGLDHLATDALASRGVRVINAPTANVLSVAEHILAMIFCLMKRIKESDLAVQNSLGRNGVAQPPKELFEKTLGLVGFGNIGSTVAKLVKPFGLNILATSRTRSSGSLQCITFTTLDDLLSRSDIISISVPLTKHTNKLLNSEQLNLIPRNSIIINTSRYAVIDHDVLEKKLRSLELGGYGVDADSIPPSLANLSNVIASPHLAGVTQESFIRMGQEVLNGIVNLLNTEKTS